MRKLIRERRSFWSIGMVYGISRQAVAEYAERLDTGGGVRANKLADNCVYPNLAQRIREDGLNATEMCQIIKAWPNSYPTRYIKRKLAGESEFTYQEAVLLSDFFEVPLEILMKRE